MAKRMNDSELLSFIATEIRYDKFLGKLYWKTDRKCGIKAGVECGYLSIKRKNKGGPYRQIHINKHMYSVHRLIYLIEHGHSPKSIIDHENRDTTDNRIENLRDVTNLENSKNTKLNNRNSSGTSGVVFKKREQKWEARISHRGKRIHLGIFNKKEDAVKCRKQAEIKYGYHTNHGT